MTRRQDYQGPRDLRRMQELVQRLWNRAGRFHVGDLAWGRCSLPGAEATFRTSLWSRGAEVVAWGWLELPAHLELLIDPTHADLLEEVLDWFEGGADGRDASCMVMEGDRHVIDALRERGYAKQVGGPFFTRHLRGVADLPAVDLPDGFRITAVDEDDAERRAAAHRAGWSDFGSRVSAESYAAVMACYPYRAETDLVVVAADGRWVASALGWYDEVNQVGLVEPVSCDPAYRRQGLARAVNVALLQAIRELGGRSATVLPRGDAAYTAPRQLYRSIGYEAGDRSVLYSRHGPLTFRSAVSDDSPVLWRSVPR